MASVGVRVERPVRLRRGVEGRVSWYGLHFWVLHLMLESRLVNVGRVDQVHSIGVRLRIALQGLPFGDCVRAKVEQGWIPHQ